MDSERIILFNSNCNEIKKVKKINKIEYLNIFT